MELFFMFGPGAKYGVYSCNTVVPDMFWAISLFILGIITLLIIIFITKGEYPNRLPKMSIEYSGQSYKAGIDEFTWFGNYGNSNLGEGEMKAAKKIQAIDMNPESEFNFKLSYEKIFQTLELLK